MGSKRRTDCRINLYDLSKDREALTDGMTNNQRRMFDNKTMPNMRYLMQR